MKLLFIIYNPAHIDNWVAKLQPYLNDCELYVFHVSKLRQKNIHILDGVKYIDVSDLSYKKIKMEIDIISPDICIHLHFRSLFELLFQRICERYRLTSVYLEHGLMSVNSKHFGIKNAKKSIGETIYRNLNFLFKYCGFIAQSSNIFGEIKNLYFFLKKNDFMFIHYDSMLVFSEREKKLLSSTFTPAAKYEIVGYPIFDDEEQKKTIPTVKEGKREGALYVHQPFILDGHATINYEEEKIFMLKMEESIKQKYGKLIILLHPRENLDDYKKRYSDTGIEVIQSPNNYRKYIDKSLVIGHYSTALLYPYYFDIPTIVTDYPTAFLDPIFTECFAYISDVNEIGQYDAKADFLNKGYFIGPHNTYEHIAHIIVSKKIKQKV